MKFNRITIFYGLLLFAFTATNAKNAAALAWNADLVNRTGQAVNDLHLTLSSDVNFSINQTWETRSYHILPQGSISFAHSQTKVNGQTLYPSIKTNPVTIDYKSAPSSIKLNDGFATHVGFETFDTDTILFDRDANWWTDDGARLVPSIPLPSIKFFDIRTDNRFLVVEGTIYNDANELLGYLYWLAPETTFEFIYTPGVHGTYKSKVVDRIALIDLNGGNTELQSGWGPERPIPTPEPSTMLLLGLGLASLVSFRKKFIKN